MTQPPLFSREFVRLLLANMAFQLGFSCFHLLPKFMAQELAAGPREIGGVTTAFGIAVVAAVPITGRLLDVLGRRRTLFVGGLLGTLSALGYPWIDDVSPLLYGLRCLQGFALSAFLNAGSAIAADRAPEGRLAQAMGMFAASGMVMTAVAPSLTEIIAEQHGYTPTFVVAAASSVIAIALAAGLYDEPRRAARSGSFRNLLRRETSLRMVAVLFVTGLGFGAMFAFSAPFSLELGMANVRGFFLSFTAAALFVRLVFGSVIDQVGHRRSATYALWSYALSVAAMGLLTPHRLELFGALFGLAHGLFIPAFTAFVVSSAASEERSKVLTLFNGAFNVGNSLVFGLGMAAERFGYRSVFAATGAVVLTAPFVLLSWPETPATMVKEST